MWIGTFVYGCLSEWIGQFGRRCGVGDGDVKVMGGGEVGEVQGQGACIEGVEGERGEVCGRVYVGVYGKGVVWGVVWGVVCGVVWGVLEAVGTQGQARLL